MKEKEWQTRKQRIDTRLASLPVPWKIVPYKEGMDTSRLHAAAVEEHPTEHGPADYVLYVSGRQLGIIEAKKVSVNPQNVLEQAKRYSRGMQPGCGSWQGEYHVPFLFATNGEIIWFIDIRLNNAFSRQLSNFFTPGALQEFFERKEDYDWFSRSKPDFPGLRYYQRDAVAAIEKGITSNRREMLVAMATGTGKTYTTVSLVYRLLESKQFKRILFLVDRRALAAQAVTAFHAFETPQGNKFTQEYEVYSQRFRKEDFEEETAYNVNQLPLDYLTRPLPSHTYVYVSTIQRMAINVLGAQHAFAQEDKGEAELEEEAEKLNIPIHAFDVIIADECHRGYTAKEASTWRSVFNHFDAIKIGLTATPASHTLNLFRHVVYRYTTEQAVLDGFLVDYDAVQIKSDVRVNGAFLGKGDTVGLVDTETGTTSLDTLEDEREFDAADIEAKITAPESNRKIITEIARYALEHEERTGRFPKTLIFAVNDIMHISHADQLVQLCREIFGRGDAFVQKITGNANVDRPLQRIREFRNRPEPKIVVTVDMLSTGVDIPAIEFIVFLRFVKSRILWVQMLGRGTRRCDGIGKTHFTVFDCFDGTLIDYFKDATDFKVEVGLQETIPIEKLIEYIYQNIDREYNVQRLVRRLHRIAKEMSGEAREDFALYIPDGDLGRFAGELPEKIAHNFIPTMQILRNKNFIELLKNYKRARQNFLIGYDVADEVSSEAMFKVGDERLKPGDYLEAFMRFVNTRKNEIEAIGILINKPENWRTQALEELHKILQLNHFKAEELARAHCIVYHLSLVDIISMIKHAVNKEAELLSPEKRVDKALANIIQKWNPDEEQKEWLGYIREHLVQNLTLDEADFAYMPVFEQHGGISAVKRVFGSTLTALIREINKEIAA